MKTRILCSNGFHLLALLKNPFFFTLYNCTSTMTVYTWRFDVLLEKIGVSKKLAPQLGSSIGSFFKLLYLHGPGIGSEADLWLLVGDP
jgi:hypothetical protein